ncbi:fumarylacetoacetate (FAA) hydrolase family protein [Sphingomonas sp. SORGH_AS802]|uniref:fumarylacetoacetate hydrolase family protein n=1 Tax=unclassified Sphingomonas TaxID=196159 RepID=UPI002865F880|nr:MULTISPECIES: fumarylacetoacetate hydrolase family protein [unclassified Sphingomonas]MDR6127829.1 fumarylacetoacetate (FAA) hydrolase family protein [Sphingomonas sp. SORGH_AS_0438]MDR6133260.1 fumarylacetoacetate (FAA) hydrolase family protein [Sphingomonas sp. SORGH_AS_0802]
MVTRVSTWAEALPADWRSGTFLGRIQTQAGPSPILVRGGVAYDMAQVAPTVSALIADRLFDGGEALGDLDTLDLAQLLSPIDLQCVKAAGVTFAVSALERVIEERARGDHNKAAELRGRLEEALGGSIRSVVPGTDEAAALKEALIADGLWSQYLEVAIGPDAEIFTKSPVLSTVGLNAPVGVRSDSTWNNPEPEVVLVADAHGVAVGATLGNDVNLRDFEGRSALLLGKAKDNTASCSLGPLIRLFDDGYSMEDVRAADVALTITGTDDYVLNGHSTMQEISRDPEELLRQALSEHHYPDGLVLFCGTLFAPTQDRDEPGKGFTHKVGDTVAIRSERLGTLINPVTTSRDAPAWTMGIGAFMANLAGRGLLGAK